MPKYFLQNTYLETLEKEMMQAPNFDKTKKTPESFVDSEVSCEDCAFFKEFTKKTCIGDVHYEQCPFLLERLIGGQANRAEVLEHIRQEAVAPPDSLFFNETHKTQFYTLRERLSCHKSNRKENAVLYLIAFSESLYQRFKGGSVEKALRGVETRGLDMESYILLCIAKDILMGTSYTSREDYEDEEIISNQTVGLVYCSHLIVQFGLNKISPLCGLLR